jgi:hypothetical protein
MPEGVEHASKLGFLVGELKVILPPMPEGVEH